MLEKFQRASCPILRSETLDQRGSIDAWLSRGFPLPNSRVRAKLLGPRPMIGMLRRKQRGSGDYEVTHDVTVRKRQVSQRAAVGKNVGTRMTVPMLHKQEQPLSRSPRALLMTPEQCAGFLGIKINTLYVMKSQGRIPYRKVGHLLRFDFDEIVEWTKDKKK